jgi:hypothetical protein
MFIQTEATPNPATLKFVPGRPVMESGTANFPTPEDAAASPLATRLYEIEGVAGVFFGADFITVTKGDGQEWVVLKPSILGVIMEHFTSGQPVMADAHGGDGGSSEGEGSNFEAQDPVSYATTALTMPGTWPAGSTPGPG